MRSIALTLFVGTVVLTACVDGRQIERVDNEATAVASAPKPGPMPSLLAALTPVTLNRRAGRSVTDALQAAADLSRTVRAEESVCPENMVLVSGWHCPEVDHRCTRWLETGGRYAYFRCAEYARPAKCLSERKWLRYCIDRDEYIPPGEDLPASNQSWTGATQTCGSLGKRVCMESEWVFACEGEEMRPYPYGFVRDATACNADRMDLFRDDGELRDLRDGVSGHPRCTSPFGVHHLSGNLEEWTTIDGTTPPRPAMKGAYWQPSRNHCRAAQTAHDTYYRGTETGFRCCRDAP